MKTLLLTLGMVVATLVLGAVDGYAQTADIKVTMTGQLVLNNVTYSATVKNKGPNPVVPVVTGGIQGGRVSSVIATGYTCFTTSIDSFRCTRATALSLGASDSVSISGTLPAFGMHPVSIN